MPFSFGLNRFFLSLREHFSMKKAIGTGLLLLANIVLLVHTVIPHHHNPFPNSCSISYHRSDPAHHCRHLENRAVTSENDRSAHRNLTLEDCLLDNIYIRFVNNNHTIQTSEQGPDIDLQFLQLYILTDNSIRIGTDYTPLPFREKPHLESFYTSHITQSKGLRAPPCC